MAPPPLEAHPDGDAEPMKSSPLTFRGVTVLEGDEDRLTGVRTYYDPAAFVQKGGTA